MSHYTMRYKYGKHMLDILERFYFYFSCCEASVGRKQQHNQDGYIEGAQILEFILFYQKASDLTRVHCASVYHSALRYEQHDYRAQ